MCICSVCHQIFHPSFASCSHIKIVIVFLSQWEEIGRLRAAQKDAKFKCILFPCYVRAKAKRKERRAAMQTDQLSMQNLATE